MEKRLITNAKPLDSASGEGWTLFDLTANGLHAIGPSTQEAVLQLAGELAELDFDARVWVAPTVLGKRIYESPAEMAAQAVAKAMHSSTPGQT